MTLVCLTGPESSGKTTLAQQLASHFEAVWLPEYSRTYLSSQSYDKQDLEQISREQYAREIDFAQCVSRVGFLDTDLINIWIWWDVRFGYVPDEVKQMLRTQPERYYLLLRPDLPWEYDPLRDKNLDREDLFNKHRTLLDRFAFQYTEISGSGKARLRSAIEDVSRILE